MGRPWITRRLADGKPALYYRAPVPGGVIFGMKRGSGPRAVLLHGGPGLGAESILGAARGAHRHRRRHPPAAARPGPQRHERAARHRDPRRGRDRPARLPRVGPFLAHRARLGRPPRDAHGRRASGTRRGTRADRDARCGSRRRKRGPRGKPGCAPHARRAGAARSAGRAPGRRRPGPRAMGGGHVDPVAVLLPRPLDAAGRAPRIESPMAGEPGTLASIAEHFDAGTLARASPSFAGPALFLHGDDDPLPASASVETAALIAGARGGDHRRLRALSVAGAPGRRQGRCRTFPREVRSRRV